MKKLMYVFIALFVFSACDNDNEGTDMATLSVKLTDTPADYEAVMIDIQDVMIHRSDNEEDGEWVSLENVNAGTFNLLDFTNGLDTVLAETELPVGNISQMRLVLGDNNQIMKNGEYHDLKTPSSQQSGLKFNINAMLTEGITYHLWIDFDAGRSVVETGNGMYILKPVIRTYTEATSGAIEGVVSPANANAYVMAISASEDTVGTYADTTSGEFIIGGLDAGDYMIKFEPKDDYMIVEKENVSVMLGNVTTMDTVFFEMAQ